MTLMHLTMYHYSDIVSDISWASIDAIAVWDAPSV